MCCDICPYFDECKDFDKLDENVCPECPDYRECISEKEISEDTDDFDEY